MSLTVGNEDSLAEEPVGAREALGCRIARLERDAAAHQALLDNMSSGLTVYRAVEDGADFVITNINRAGERISQVRRADVVGRRLREVFPAVDEFGLLAVLRTVWETGARQRHGPALYADGRIEHWAQNDVYKLPNGDVVAVYDDVTDKVRALAALRESEDRFRTLAEDLPIGLYRTTAEGQILYANRALHEMLGYPDAESILRQRAGVGYVDPLERERFLGVLERDGVVRAYEARWQRLDGRLMWIRESARMVRDIRGLPLYIEGTAEDITEQKEVEAAAKDAEERFRYLVEKARIGILIDDPQGRFSYFNNTFATMFGYSREEMEEQTIEAIVHPLDLERVLAQHRGRVQGKAPSAHYDFMGIRKDRLPIYLEVDALELREGDRVIGTSSYLWDITGRKTAEQERERLIRELKEALARVKILSGLLPICSSCKRIRDDAGYWQKVETYIHVRSDAEFTHGICPDCMKKLYPEYADDPP